MQTDNMQPTAPLNADQMFFFRHAGYSHDPLKETPAQGRTRCAISLAESEALYLQAHRVADVRCEWEAEFDPDLSWLQPGETVHTFECAAIWFGPGMNDDECLASLGNITDADANYRRVVRAELASECADRLRAIIEEHADGMTADDTVRNRLA